MKKSDSNEADYFYHEVRDVSRYRSRAIALFSLLLDVLYFKDLLVI